MIKIFFPYKKGTMMKNKKILIIIAGLAILVGIGTSIYMVNKSNHKNSNSETTLVDNMSENEVKDTLKSLTEFTDEQIDALSNEEKEQFLTGDGYQAYIGAYKIENDNREYPEEQFAILEAELKAYAEKADYQKIIDTINEKRQSYKFTESYNLNIASIFHDAEIMMALKDYDYIKQGEVAKSMLNPEMMVSGTLMLEEKSRRGVITDKDSLSPIFDGPVKIKEHEIISNENDEGIVKRIYNFCTGATVVHKITFEIEKNELIAYVVEYSDKTLEFFGIYAPDGVETYYQSISFWEQIEADTMKHFELE